MTQISLEEARAALARKRAASSPAPDPNAGINQFEAGLIGVGKGMTDIINLGKEGFNFVTGNDQAQAELEARMAREQELFQGLLDDERLGTSAMVGEILGETAAAAPAGFGAGGAAVKGVQLASKNPLLTRLVGSGAAGATEGGIVAATEDKGAEGAALGGGLAVTAELFLPKFLDVAKRVFRNPNIKIENLIQMSDGQAVPTQDFNDALQTVGLSFDDISQQAVRELPQGANPQQVAREQLFQAEGIEPAARSRITQNPDDFQRELQLARQRGTGEGDERIINEFRDRFFDESAGIQRNLTNLSEQLGDPESVGTVKTALQSLNSNMQSAKRNAYRDLAELTEGNPAARDAIPVPTDNILAATQSAQSFLDNSMASKVDEVLAEFGLAGEAGQRRGRFTPVDFGDGDIVNVRGDIRPINVGNLEEFRKRFNEIFDVTDPRQAAARGQIIEAIENSSDELVEGLGESNVSGEIVDAARNARSRAREQKQTFNQKDLVQNLVANKPGTSTPIVEASNVLQKVKAAPAEQQSNLIRTLRREGEQGEAAIRNLQAAKVVELLENATRTTSKLVRSEGAEPISDFNGKKFRQDLNKERDLINTLFESNPEALEQLNRIRAIGELRLTPEVAAQKGSAPDLVNSLLRSVQNIGGKVPVAGEAVEGAAGRVMSQREAGQLTDLAPTQAEVEDFIVFNAPRLAANLGLSGATVSAAAPE